VECVDDMENCAKAVLARVFGYLPAKRDTCRTGLWRDFESAGRPFESGRVRHLTL